MSTPLWVTSGRVRTGRVIAVAGSPAEGLRVGLLRLRQTIGDRPDLTGARVDVPARVGRPCRACRRRVRPSSAACGLPHSSSSSMPARRQVIGEPFLLGAEEPLDVGGVAAVLVGRREQILLPDDAVGLRQIVVELREGRIRRFDSARATSDQMTSGPPSSACASSRPGPVPRGTRPRSCAAVPRSACCPAPSRRASPDGDARAA